MKPSRRQADAHDWFFSPDDERADADRSPPEPCRVEPAAEVECPPIAWCISDPSSPAIPEPEPVHVDDCHEELRLVPHAHRRWAVRSAAVVGAASAVCLLVLVDQLLRTPAMATDLRGPPTAIPAPRAAPTAASAPAPAEPPAASVPTAPSGVPAPGPAVTSEIPRPEPEPEPEPETGFAITTEAVRRLPLLAPKPAAAGQGQTRTATHLRWAATQLRDGLFQWARWNYKQAVRLAPNDPEAHFGLALAATELRRDKQARAEVEKALALDPRHPLAHVLAGYLAQLRGEAGGAREHYERYLEIEPHGPFAPQVRAILSDRASLAAPTF